MTPDEASNESLDQNEAPPGLRSRPLRLTGAGRAASGRPAWWIAPALALPVILLAGLSVWLVRAEQRAVVEDARGEAQRMVDSLMAEIQEMLPQAVIEVPAWQVRRLAPPVNAEALTHWEALQAETSPTGTQVEYVLREGHHLNVWTPSGLPIAMLAAQVGLEKLTHVEGDVRRPAPTKAESALRGDGLLTSPSTEEKAKAAATVVRLALRYPNVLSSRLIRDAARFLPPADAAVAFRKAESVDAILRCSQSPSSALASAELELPTGRCLIHRKTAGGMDFLCLELLAPKVLEGWNRWNAMVPNGLVLDFRWNGQSVTTPTGNEVDASLERGFEIRHPSQANSSRDAVDFKSAFQTQPALLAKATLGDFEFTISEKSGDRSTTRSRDRLQWLSAGLGVAVVATAAAMLAVWFALRRQARLSRLQSEFVASVSHELRTPVASIGVLAERLEQGDLPPEKAEQYRQWMTREGRRLGNLVDNILDFSRIEQDRKHYEFDAIDLPRLVTETVAILQPYAEERQISLTSEISWPDETPAPEMDASAIRQALINLIENALKFTPAGGSVIVQLCGTGVPPVSLDVLAGSQRSPASGSSPAYGRDARATLSVTDTGIGIPVAERQRIFHKFYRILAAPGQETTGAGIGLSIVKHTVEAHGGTIAVKDHAGPGVTFEMCFQFSATN